MNNDGINDELTIFVTNPVSFDLKYLIVGGKSYLRVLQFTINGMEYIWVNQYL